MRARRRTVAAVGALLVLAAACSPPSSPPAALSQEPPLGVNGMVQDGEEVWVADLFGRQLVRFSPDTGVISERIGMDAGLCTTDDPVVLPDGDLVATCPTQGRVVRAARGTNTSAVLAEVGRNVNPVALEPGGTSVLVGFGTDEDGRLLRVPVDGGPVEVVTDGLPPLNGFGFGPDGLLWAPTGGVAGSFGTGGLATVDPTTGTFTPVPLSFPDEPHKRGFAFACGADVALDGTVFVAQCWDAAVYRVDPATGAATLVGRNTAGVADNVLVLSDGRVLLSDFFGGTVTVFTPTGSGYGRSALRIGS